MKLSDAIMLGITRYRLEPRTWVGDDCGCLCGIGYLAAGGKDGHSWDADGIDTQWPWLRCSYYIPELLQRVRRLPQICSDKNWAPATKGYYSGGSRRLDSLGRTIGTRRDGREGGSEGG